MSGVNPVTKKSVAPVHEIGVSLESYHVLPVNETNFTSGIFFLLMVWFILFIYFYIEHNELQLLVPTPLILVYKYGPLIGPPTILNIYPLILSK